MKINIIGYVLIVLLLIICIRIYLNSEYFNLRCIISNVDGETYCVRERSKLSLAADKLANANKKLKHLVEYCKEKYPDRKNIIRLAKGYNPDNIVETLPTSKYTAYSLNKGEKLAFCLDTKKNGGKLIDDNTLIFVAIHELAHIATKSVGHTDEFWNNFKFLLEEAVNIKIYNPVDYSKHPEKYCGMEITDNPYFDK